VSYYNELFPAGTRVRIAQRQLLEEFKRTWKYHHKLRNEQLDWAGQMAIVKGVAFYHGGDPIYTLSGVPGLWHEQCLGPE